MTNQNEQEWWDDERYVEFNGGQELPTVYNIPAIVAEAERRGRVAAWEEAKEMVEKQKLACKIITVVASYGVGAQTELEIMSNKVNAKLTELKKV